MSPSSRQPTGFLDLPLEIRLQIYRDCLVCSYPIVVHDSSMDPYDGCFDHDRSSDLNLIDLSDQNASLLSVSKKVGYEALEVFYGDNVFQVYLNARPGFSLKVRFTEANIRRIRMMQVVMRPPGIFGRMVDSTVLSPVLANLKKLSIVAQQPLEAESRYDPPTFHRRMQVWIGWLQAFLQYNASRLPDSCVVEVDDDDRTETSTVMRECLPGGCRKVQTLAGDKYFVRNDYSIESDDENDDYCWQDWQDVDSNAS